MPHSYTQLYIHYIFAPKHRYPIPDQEKRGRLLSYMSGIVTNNKSILISGSVMPDHVHLLIGIHPSVCVSELAQKVKSGSSKLMNDEKWFSGRFSWNEGYGAFTVSQSKLAAVKQYISGQEEHHRKHKLYDEMMEFLKAHGLKADNKENFWQTEP